MPFDVKDWQDRPTALDPLPDENLHDWLVRITEYQDANPGVLTPLEALALKNLEVRLSDYTDAQVAALTALVAPIASPALTGNPTAPTPLAGDNDVSIATTAFVTAAVAIEAGVRAANDTSLGAPNVQTDTDYTFVAADAGKVVEGVSAAAHIFTVPANADVPYPIGTVIEGARMGAGTLTFAAAAGVTIRSNGGKLAIAHQYSSAVLRKRATNEWVLVGDLA